MWSKEERALVVAAHPDDEVLGCGGAIARIMDNGGLVRVLFLTEGVTARHEPREFDRPEVQKAIVQRCENAVRALGHLGVPREEIFFNSRPDCRLDVVPQIELVKQIEEHLSDLRPTRVFMHAAHDPSVDHRLAHAAMLPALRPIGVSPIRAVYVFEVLSATEWNPEHPFAPRVFIDIGDVLERKIDAMRRYEDELREPPHPRSEQVIRALAVFRGAQAGLSHAEGFELFRGIDI